MLGNTEGEKLFFEFTNPGGIFGAYKGWRLGRAGDVDMYKAYQLSRAMNKSNSTPMMYTPLEMQPKILYSTGQSAAPKYNHTFQDAYKFYRDQEFIRLYNRWNKFGYPEIPKSIIDDPVKVEKFVRGILNRHNTYARGVIVYPREKKALEQSLGRRITDDEFLKISATTSREAAVSGYNGEPVHLWISPFSEISGIYGQGKLALVRRPFSLGDDKLKWFDEASFNIQFNPGNGEYTEIMAPWSKAPKFDSNGILSRIMNYGHESELLSPVPMEFVGFRKANPHINHKLSLNTNPIYTDPNFAKNPVTGEWKYINPRSE